MLQDWHSIVVPAFQRLEISLGVCSRRTLGWQGSPAPLEKKAGSLRLGKPGDDRTALQCSLPRELEEEKEKDLLPDEKYFLSCDHPDSSESTEPLTTSLPSDETKVSSALDRAKPCPDARLEVKNPPKLEGGELEGSAVQKPGCEVPVPMDATSVLTEKIIKIQRLLSKQRMACRVPGLQASENHENKDDKGQDSLTSSILNRELLEEKENDLPDEKYFSSCGHPDSSESTVPLGTSLLTLDETKVISALDAAKPRLDACLEVKNPPKCESGELEGSVVKTPGFLVPVLIDATSDLTEKIIRRKQLLSKWRIACRFSGLHASGSHEKKDDKEQDSLNSRGLQEEKEHDPLPDAKYFPSWGHPDSSDSTELLGTAVSPSDETKVNSALDGTMEDEDKDALINCHILQVHSGECDQGERF
ncbi:uncharacterized protein LOC124994793 [Sciurus carolinensis]|uniref:uncharacterized protein LOC124994793 n=1 Tax=Sciurus carolinensis TaxID=30640 RepID=UPI001FB3C9EB|nr:uncharacterized protein LOC124994793 [Sciurus carolinensis]